jgi:hypothetical protein
LHTRDWIAEVIGARITIVGVGRGTSHALARRAARVADSASVAVAARGSDRRRVGHAACGVARIDGAWISVVDDEGGSGSAAGHRIARLGSVADVAIATRGITRLVQDSASRLVARVGRAVNVVVQARRCSRHATGCRAASFHAVAEEPIVAVACTRRHARGGSVAGIAHRAGVSVVARASDGDEVLNAGLRIAKVVGTRIAVVGIDRDPGDALACCIAGIAARAQVSVTTGDSNAGDGHAPPGGIAMVGSTTVTVVTYDSWVDTPTRGATVLRAVVAVVAR